MKNLLAGVGFAAVVLALMAAVPRGEGNRWFTEILIIGTNQDRITGAPRGTATLDFPTTAVDTCDDLTITVATSSATGEVLLGVPNTAVATGSSFWGWVSAAGTVTVRHCCDGAANCDPASADFSARVINP